MTALSRAPLRPRGSGSIPPAFETPWGFSPLPQGRRGGGEDSHTTPTGHCAYPFLRIPFAKVDPPRPACCFSTATDWTDGKDREAAAVTATRRQPRSRKGPWHLAWISRQQGPGRKRGPISSTSREPADHAQPSNPDDRPSPFAATARFRHGQGPLGAPAAAIALPAPRPRRPLLHGIGPAAAPGIAPAARPAIAAIAVWLGYSAWPSCASTRMLCLCIRR
ncbi:hypothetical protein L602_001700000760 [Cupriavidus gilardii J11]|uniref:Uncharacterized protein n=1 Tax=Cupriavidus gilardii J11 TaxID=936133 RepID=A0A562BQP6_9BURK|nr:hypothetical protein L602_001700000760 [Cupriavidus gilardii J11]